MSLDQAEKLLNSSSLEDVDKGLVGCINSFANASNTREVLYKNLHKKVIPLMDNANSDIVMKAVWAVNNLCCHEIGRRAVYQEGVSQYITSILRRKSPEIIQKSCWMLTNLTKDPEAQRELGKTNLVDSLVSILNNNSISDDIKAIVISPISNLALVVENQPNLARSGIGAPIVRLLSSPVDQAKSNAINLVANITIGDNHIRDQLVRDNVLKPIIQFLYGDGTELMQSLALNSLINLSNSDIGEKAILESNALEAVVGLLMSSNLDMVKHAAMLLGNLCSKKEFRETMRTYDFFNPITNVIKTTKDISLLQQMLRVVVNICLDGYCRYLLKSCECHQEIGARAKSLGDQEVTQLAVKALQNLKAGIQSDVELDAQSALKRGTIRKISPPKAQKEDLDKKRYEKSLEGLDDLLSNIQNG